MQLVVQPDGSLKCVYGEAIDFHALGHVSITRGSHVEPDSNGQWLVDLSPVSGPVLGPFPTRSEALEAELGWLEVHWLTTNPKS